MALFGIISSYLVGRYLKQLGGRTTVVFAATLMIITQALILGLLDNVEDETIFLQASFVA
jgi:hypothetical protein